jgi:hypothetical protein
VVCKLWTYIKANELQDPTDKRKILLDPAMAEVFGVQELTMFSLNKELTSHLSNIPVPAPVQQEGEVDGGSVGDVGSVGDMDGNEGKDIHGDRDGVDQRDMYDEEDVDDDAVDDRDEDDEDDNDNENENEDEVVYDGEFEGGDEGGREGEAAVQSDVASPGVYTSLPLALCRALVLTSDLRFFLPSLAPFHCTVSSYSLSPYHLVISYPLLTSLTFTPYIFHMQLERTMTKNGGMLTQGPKIRDRGHFEYLPSPLIA